MAALTDGGETDGVAFLLDGKLKAIQVGWAYIPSSHSFECAIISGP